MLCFCFIICIVCPLPYSLGVELHQLLNFDCCIFLLTFHHCFFSSLIFREAKKKNKVSSKEVDDATTLHDFSTASVLHPVGSSPPLKRKKTTEMQLENVPVDPLPIVTKPSKNPSVQIPPPAKIPMLSPKNGYFE